MPEPLKSQVLAGIPSGNCAIQSLQRTNGVMLRIPYTVISTNNRLDHPYFLHNIQTIGSKRNAAIGFERSASAPARAPARFHQELFPRATSHMLSSDHHTMEGSGSIVRP